MQGEVCQPEILVGKSVGGQHGHAVVLLRGKASRPPHREGWQKGALLGLGLWLTKGRAAGPNAGRCRAGGNVVGLGRTLRLVEPLRRKFVPRGNVCPHVTRNEVVQAFRIGSPRPGADIEPVVGVGVGEGQARAATKTQIVAAALYPLAHGFAPRGCEGRSLEAGIAAGNQQQRHTRAALMLAAIGACAPRLA